MWQNKLTGWNGDIVLLADCAAEMEKAWIEKPLLATARVEILMCGQDVQCLFVLSSRCFVRLQRPMA